MIDNVYVITGASSFIGVALIETLVNKGKTIYAICREHSENLYKIPQHENVHIIYCDLSKLNELEMMIKEHCHIFYHLGWSTVEKNNLYLQNENVRYTLDGVHVAKKLGCHTFIGAGSQAEYGIANVPLDEDTPTLPVTGYGMAKLCAGQMSKKLCAELEMKHVWARILSVYGKYAHKNTFLNYVINTIANNEIPNLTHCEQIWDFLHVLDCADILYQLSKVGQDGKVYVVGSGDAKTLKYYVEIIRQTINPKGVINFGAKEIHYDTPTFLLSKEKFCGLIEYGKVFDADIIKEIIQK